MKEFLKQHIQEAENIRVNSANHFFFYTSYGKDKVSIDFEEPQTDKATTILELYNGIKQFVDSHNNLIEVIIANKTQLSEEDIKSFNGVIAIMNGIIRSFPEIGIYDLEPIDKNPILVMNK